MHTVVVEALSGPKKMALWANPHDEELRVWQVGTTRHWPANGQRVSDVLKGVRDAWHAAGVLVRSWTTAPLGPNSRPHFQEREFYSNAQHGGAINAYLVFKRLQAPDDDEMDMDTGDTTSWYVVTDCRPEDVRCVDDVLPAEEAKEELAHEILGWLAGFGLRYATPLSDISPTGRTYVTLYWRWSGKRFFAQNCAKLDC